jgi:5-methylcytosine-specific restriction protein A
MPRIFLPKRKRRDRLSEPRRQERQEVYSNPLWYKLRTAKMMNNPLCEDCERKGIVTPATQVHHVVSFMSTDDPELRYKLAFDYDNLVSLCEVCHQKRHGKLLRDD